VSKSKDSREAISNKYKQYIDTTNANIEKMYPDDAKRIRSNYSGDDLDKKLSDLYRHYYVKNQEKVAKEINTLFKENNFDLKLYIL
jgi:hypothetical protein